MTRRFFATALLGLILVGPQTARGDEASPAPGGTSRHRISPHLNIGRPTASTPAGSGGWWIGSVMLALTLLGLGAASLAARRFLPSGGDPGGTLQVVGRTGLSPKQSVYLLRVGDRVLIVGAGAQGAPSLLGEIDDPAEIKRLTAGRKATATGVPASAMRLLNQVGGRLGSAS